MALPVIYTSGTASVTNGETTVTGVNTLWGDDAIMAGDLFCDPAQPLVPPQRIASVTDDGSLELAVGWPGTTMSGDAYEIRFVGIIERSTAQSRRVLEQLGVARANGQGVFYKFSDTTTDADPGPGYFRLNNADPALATAAYIDDLNANGGAMGDIIDKWDDSTSVVKGVLIAQGITDKTIIRAYSVTGSVVDGTGYRKLTLTHIGGSGSFSADDELMVAFARTGDTGEGYVTDATVADPSELTALEGEAAGYLVFVTDLQTDFGAFSGRSGVVELIAGPDWQLVAVYTGPKGDTGDQGDKGWSPKLVIVSDGARRVFQLAGYVGGAGSAPTANVGDYLKGDGTFTATIGDAVDVRGPAGLNGSGTVASVESGAGTSVDDTDPTAPIVNVVAFTGDSGSGGAIGGVPAPSAGDAAANKFLSAGGSWLALDLSSLEITVSLLALQVADNTNVALFLGDAGNRVADSFDALTYVDVAGGTNLDTSSAGLLKPTVTAGSMISQATGTAIGNFGENYGSLSLLFNGTTNVGSGGEAATNAATSGKYFGKTYSGGQSVSKARVYGRNDAGYVNSITPTVTIELCWKDGAAPNSTASDATVAGSVSFTETNTTNMQEITSNTSAPHDHWVLRFSHNGAANVMFAVEGEFFGPSTNNNLTVRSSTFTAASVPTAMKALLRVKEVDAAVAGTDYTLECSRDGGTTWSTMALTELFTSPSPTAGMRVVEAAETDVSGQPSGTSPRWRFKTLNNKMVELHDVYLYWD